MPDQVITNEYGEVVLISHPMTKQQPDAFTTGGTPTQLANAYISDHMAEMGLAESRLESDEAALFAPDRENDPVISISGEKDIAGSTVVVYEQSVMNMPIFDARMGVHVDTAARAVTSVQSSMHGHVEIANPDAKEDRFEKQTLSETEIKEMLGVDLPNQQNGWVERQVVYRFEPDQRVEADEDEHRGFGGAHPEPPELPDLPEAIEKGKHYITNEILFKASRFGHETPLNWRALVEPETGAVLYIRALVANATGMVFAKDPQTQTGANVTGSSSNAVLNPFRSTVTLPGLIPATPQPLSGEYVRIEDFDIPTAAPPIVPNPFGAYNFDVRTNNFSAVNAYFHCDYLFRTMDDYGFNVATYFNGTTFPVPVDHRSRVNTPDGNEVNASAPGNSFGNGLGEMRYALVQVDQPVGMATSNRVVWHEFGHALLWDHVNSPNFGFAHSAGDAMAAILNDPGSNEPDRFNTFPWVLETAPTARRHDRAIADGWAWFGSQYNTQYGGEQVLSTTLFRFYRSIGGDSSSLNTQTRAAQTSVYLIMKAIGLLTSMTSFPEVYVTKLQEADKTTPNFKGIPGGALHKVVRWAFEKQGLFQPGAQPGVPGVVTTEGNPPEVDVYIDDGRAGEYQYLGNHWSCQDMWVRNSADGGLTHQTPLVGLTNYMYVRVKNRGQQDADNVRVDAYHCLPGTGLSFPDDWIPMATPTLPAGSPVPSGGETIVGPFAFVPTQVGHECLLAIAHADDDPGNDTTLTGTIPEHRFVPFDNNIGQRNVHPVLPTLRHLVKLLREHRLWIRNPLKTPALCRIEIELPRFLRRLGWELHIVSAGSARFEMGPRDRREVMLNIEPGQQFSLDVAKRAIAEGDHEIKVLTFLDDELSGGMTYQLSFDVSDDRGDEQPPPRREPLRRALTIEEILSILRENFPFAAAPPAGRRIRTVRLELDMFDDDTPGEA